MLEFLEVQEEYIKDEQRNLKKEYLHAQEEVKRIQSVPLVIGQFLEAVDQNTGIVGSTTGSNYYVRILSTIDRELLKPSASVALHKHSNALVDVLPPEADSSISMLQAGKNLLNIINIIPMKTSNRIINNKIFIIKMRSQTSSIAI
jgi:26S proteasome regulatory subunit T3